MTTAGPQDMVSNMKATIDIAHPLLSRSKRLARERHVTLRALVEEGLERVLRESRDRRPARIRPVVVDGKGVSQEYASGGWTAVRDTIYKGHGS